MAQDLTLQESQAQTQSEDNLAQQVYQSRRAKVLYDDPTDDGSVDLTDEGTEETITAESDELDVDVESLDFTDLPDDPEQDTEEFVEGSPRFEQFKSDFKSAFGMEMSDAKDLLVGLQQQALKQALNEQKYELSAAWNAPISVVEQRLAVVAKMWSQLPPDKQQAYDSVKGAIALYTKHEKSGKAAVASKVTAKSTQKPPTNDKGYMYTEKQIERMTPEEWALNSQRVMYAYANGRVKRNA